MKHLLRLAPGGRTSFWLAALALLALLLAGRAARAQSPGWAGATPGSLTQANGTSTTRAVATDASGNVFVTGSFTGSVAFGGTLLSSLGSNDLFVAKYVPATGTWAWAQSGGGTSIDQGLGVAVSGSSVYVTGSITNNAANASGVLFGGTGTTPGTVQQYGATGGNGQDLVLAKYTDNGSSATLGWTQVGGGFGTDIGYGVAVSGTSVYVTGSINNTTANGSGVLFGGTGTTAGTVQQNGASGTINTDLVLAKYTDNGPSATLGWTQVGGGAGSDIGYGVAVSGTSVYVTGSITNSTANDNGVLFGGTGTTAGTVQQNGASGSNGQDLVLAKYTDNGPSATLGWTQVGGGAGSDIGYGVAASGTSVYVTGSITNNTANTRGVLFGGTGTTAGTVQQNGASGIINTDLVLAKYTDNGPSATLGWTQVGGGTDGDIGYGVAASGTSVYVTGYIINNTANGNRVLFGGTGTTAGTVPQNGATGTNSIDLVLAKYTDNGPSATLGWTQAGGGTGNDTSYGVAVSGSSVVAGAYLSSTPAAAFGAATGAPVLGTAGNRAVLALADAGTGSWQAVAPAFNGGTSTTRGVATDASGNVFVTGNFTGQVDFGGTLLSSLGSNELFVAKYVPATGTWAWAQSGGGAGSDTGYGVAVSGSSVYVTGSITNSTFNTSGVLFGGTGTTAGTVQQYGATGGNGQDLVLAKYTDNGSSATLGWTQVGGGTSSDIGYGVAVSGTSVYVTGQLINNTANASGVLFGGTGTTAGTVLQNGASSTNGADLVLARYTDNGPSATLGWTQVGGGTSVDQGYGVAVSGNLVYVTGYIQNSTANGSGVLFGGTGTTAGTVPQYGASGTINTDLVLARYTDNGPSATLGWTQVGGGTSSDIGYGVAVSGTSVYVTGYINNSTSNGSGVLFGGTGTTAGTVPQYGVSGTINTDLVLAKYTDNGSSAALGWTQVGGGTSSDIGYGVAVSGSSVYVTGSITNTTANASGVLFGGTGTTPGTVPQNGASGTNSQDLVLARYTDNGGSATLGWTQVGGGPSTDIGYGVATSGQNVLAAGYVTPSASFGAFTIASPAGAATTVLARAVDNPAPLPVQLVSFTATASGPAAVRLAWATASEVNSHSFEVERSLDGMTFAKLGTLAAAGTSSTARAYAFTDAGLPAGASRLYYRLRQVDQDGTAHYSPVRAVALAGASARAGLSLYPNPAPGGAATLLGAAPGTVVTVLDALGRPVATALADASGTAALPGGLTPGVYVVRAGQQARRLTVE